MGERLANVAKPAESSLRREQLTRWLSAAAAAGRYSVSAEELLRQSCIGAPTAFSLPFRLEIMETRAFGTVISAVSDRNAVDSSAGFSDDSRATASIAVTAAAELTDPDAFYSMLRRSVIHRNAAGIDDEQFLGLCAILLDLARYFSPINPGAPFVIESLTVQGECRFRRPVSSSAPKPIWKIGNLLHPESVGIVGVSASKMNFGRIILKNIVASGYDKASLAIIKPGNETEIDGVRCAQDLASLDHKLDLLIVAVSADAAFAVVDEIIEFDAANSVLLVPGGLGETEASREPARAMVEGIKASRAKEGGGPVFLGGNCLGVVSHPGNFNSWFIPRELLPKPLASQKRRSALVSQSGAFMITRLSKNAWLDPAYLVAVGNQNDLTHGDMLRYFCDRDDIDVVAFYIEGFADLDGLTFAQAVQAAVSRGKQIVVYKAGRSAAGRDATMGHTASVAGDYDLCVSLLTQAGAMVAETFGEFTDLFYIASCLHQKTIKGNRLAAVSGAGFETVAIADSVVAGEAEMAMSTVDPDAADELASILRDKRLDALMEIRNPFDINPGADDETHIRCAEVFANDSNVDAVVVGLDPLSPVTRTLEKSAREGFDIHSDESLASTFSLLTNRHEKPIIGIIEGGPMYEPFAAKLKDQGACIFRSTDRGVRALVKYTAARLKSLAVREA